jgi:hypothetical protein
MFNTENALKKWGPVLDHKDAPKIKDNYRRAVTAALLENQERAMKEERAQGLYEGSAASVVGPSNGFDPILISLVRRAMPNLIAYDIAGVQPKSAPTGLIFALKSNYQNASGANTAEALYGGRRNGTAATTFAAHATTAATASTITYAGTLDTAIVVGNYITGGNLLVLTKITAISGGVITFTPGVLTGTAGAANAVFTVSAVAMDPGFSGPTVTADSEVTINAQMGFSIEKTTVTAKTRALKAEYTMELAQDLKAVHGLDAESELANILSSEILFEINREVIKEINTSAAPGGYFNATTGVSDGKVDMSKNQQADSPQYIDGRWSAEKYKNLMMYIEKDANRIAKDTRRGKGNFVIVSSNVASALAGAGVLDYAPALSTNLEVDDTGNTFAGVLNGRIKVYVDPYAAADYATVGYRGTNPYDAGIFYAPYVPLTMVRAIDPANFQPKIAFKTRYGLVHNPFVGAGAAGTNFYYRTFTVTNLI